MSLAGIYGPGGNTRGGTTWQQNMPRRMPQAGGSVSSPNAAMAQPLAQPPATPPRPGAQFAQEIMANLYGINLPQQPQQTPSAPRIGAGSAHPMANQMLAPQGNPNMNQMSPQAQVVFDQIRQQQAARAGDPQAKAAQAGVFAGQQQPVAMPPPPPMTLPELYSGGR